MSQVDGVSLSLGYGQNPQDEQHPKPLTTRHFSAEHLLPMAPCHHACIIFPLAVTECLTGRDWREKDLSGPAVWGCSPPWWGKLWKEEQLTAVTAGLRGCLFTSPQTRKPRYDRLSALDPPYKDPLFLPNPHLTKQYHSLGIMCSNTHARERYLLLNHSIPGPTKRGRS